MRIKNLRLAGLKLISPSVFRDERGYFLENYRQPLYDEHEMPHFVQDNVSFSKKGVVRALHFQSRPGQAKLVRCEQGKIFDVAVDIRPDSATFGQWEGVFLDGENHEQLFVPIGFAHGFCVLSETALVHYKVSTVYNPNEEKTIRWNDPDIGIDWPVDEPILSQRDQISPYLKEALCMLGC